MVCDGPDPPENTPQEMSPPSRSDLMMQGPQAEDSEEELTDYIGYQPLPQGPEQTPSDPEQSDDDDDDTVVNEETVPDQTPPTAVPPIEPVASILARQLWNAPRTNDPIRMDTARAQQVMSAMANFRLPATAIPEWAQSISEEQWQRTLSDTIHRMKGDT